MAAPRVFVSHTHSDNEWCREFVAALQAAGWDVWYDEKGLGAGAEWVRVIQDELQARENFLLVLTPNAWASEWVQKELNLALATHRQIIAVLHQETPDVRGFLLDIRPLKKRQRPNKVEFDDRLAWAAKVAPRWLVHHV